MIIYEDESFLILNKPSGWSIYPQGSRPRPSITSWLNIHYPISSPIRPVHRLDVETSGLLICGKTQEVVSGLNALFRSRRVKKTYWAICHHKNTSPLLPINTLFSIDIPLGFDRKSQVRIKMGRGDQASLTDYRVYQYSPCQTLAWLEVSPHTGRQHQIRVHLSLVGLSIVGDKLYGIDESFFLKAYENILSKKDLEILQFPRQLLHACQIDFEWKSKYYQWKSPWPNEVLSHFTWLSHPND